MIRVQVVGVGFLPDDATPMMLLREATGRRRWLTISIGEPEAEALIAARDKVSHFRPNTVELLVAVVDAFDRGIEGVEITALHEGVFHADLLFDAGSRVSARPSDAVAVAVLAEVEVDVSEAVMDEAGREMDVADPTDPEAEPGGQADEISAFRSFLDAVTPQDFENPPPP